MQKNRCHRFQSPCRTANKAQTAIEYLVLLGVVTAVVLVMFKKSIPAVVIDAEEYYNKTAIALYGDWPVANKTFVNYP